MGRGGQDYGGGNGGGVRLEFVDLTDTVGKDFGAHPADSVACPLTADPRDTVPKVANLGQADLVVR